MQALHWGCSENCFNETATQLQALEIILISFLVWLIYSKTISGLTKILMMLEQHLHRGGVEGAVFRGSFHVTPEQVCSWAGSPGEQEKAQSPGSSRSPLQAGSAVEELSGGQQWLASPVVPPALSCLPCSF